VLSPDETTLYSGGADKGIRAWEARSGLWLRTFVGGHSGFVTAMAVSADGLLLFTGCEATYGDGSVKVRTPSCRSCLWCVTAWLAVCCCGGDSCGSLDG
jgi:WD40 repeat protein